MSGLTSQAARFLRDLDFASLPERAVETVSRGWIDCVAAQHFGLDEPVTGIVAHTAAIGTEGEAAVLWGRARARADVAALVNATAAHALDFDDTSLEGHPSAVLIPVVMAVGEALGASGRDAVTAYVAGYELWAELLQRETHSHRGKGFHPTAIFGAVASAAASAWLMRLDEAKIAAALGVAVSLASGLVANFGSMTKPLQVGRAAQNGIVAARLAAAGLSAAPDALEHAAGFLAAFSPQGAVDRERPSALGREWNISRHGLNIKTHAVCYALHRVVDSALSLTGPRGVATERILRIRVLLGRRQFQMLRPEPPRTAMEAKFSAEFSVAAALVAGGLGLPEVSDTFLARRDVQNLMRRVSVLLADDADPDQPLFAPFDQVFLETEDGGEIAGNRVRFARGHARNPIGLEILKRKFDDALRPGWGEEGRERLFARLAHPERLAAVAELYE